MKDFFTILFSCIIGTCAQGDQPVMDTAPVQTQQVMQIDSTSLQRVLQSAFTGKSFSANYLASQYAQNHHDWKRAVEFMEPVLKTLPDDPQLLNKAMVLAIGSGQMEKAAELAHRIANLEGDRNTLADLLIALEKFQKKDYQGTLDFIAQIPEGGLSDFVLPLLESWAYAGMGALKLDSLDQNTIHLYHAILIADYLGQQEQIKDLLAKSLGAQGLSLQDIERIADVYAHTGDRATALDLYEKLFEQWPENRALGQKLENFRAGREVAYLDNVTAPEQGLGEALYDMARLLFQEKSDESARVFAHMALYVDPGLTDADLLLGYVTARNKNYDEAIAYYRQVGPDDPQYAESRRMAADLMESIGMVDRALAELEDLAQTHKDIEAVIQIGDIYRRQEDFAKAAATYDRAADILGNPVPREYWQLLYVRGISYERLGNWPKAEKDLMQALEYQPDHPLILNYLGYAWADQGVNLRQSLEYIRKAAAFQPADGYITDSLGWVLYRMGQHAEAVPHLERAVELLPYDSVINDHLGDVYWQVGRKMEARFQWARAKNYAQDEKLAADIAYKLENGLQNIAVVKEAKTQAPAEIDLFKSQ